MQQLVLTGIKRVMAASGSIGHGISKFEAKFESVPQPGSTPDLGRVPSEF
jgi:hypothetical protein